MAIAGRVLIIPKGEYSSTVAYKPLDLVSSGSSAWLCKKACISIQPSSATSEYWFPMSNIALANALNITTEGYALDARQGKALSESLASLAANQTVIETSITTLSATVNGLMGTSIAAAYDSTATYDVGDYVTYNNDLYVCTTKISTAEAFNSSHWKHCYIMEEIDDKVTEIVEDVVTTSVSTEIGNLTSGAGLYADCTTAADTAAKTVALTGFTLKSGARVTVNFQHANTAASPTLNVASTGAKEIRYRSSSSTYAVYKDIPMGPVTLSYNGNYWVAEGGKVNGFTSGTYAPVMGLAYDATNKKLGLKVLGADSVVPFSEEPTKTQTVSKTVTFKQNYSGTSLSESFTFSNLTKLVGITAIATSYTKGNAYIKKIQQSISGNTVTLTVDLTADNQWVGDIAVTGIGY